MEKTKGSYLVREFMYKDLKLGGIRLMLYAALYSFTVRILSLLFILLYNIDLFNKW